MNAKCEECGNQEQLQWMCTECGNMYCNGCAQRSVAPPFDVAALVCSVCANQLVPPGILAAKERVRKWLEKSQSSKLANEWAWELLVCAGVEEADARVMAGALVAYFAEQKRRGCYSVNLAHELTDEILRSAGAKP